MEVIKETLWKRCLNLSTPTKPPAKNSNICLSETAYQHKGARKKCKKTNQAAIIQWQRQCLMYKPHRKPWPKSKTSSISKQSPSSLHHTFLLGRASFTAQPLSALDQRRQGRFPFNKNSALKFPKLHVLNGTVHSGCTDPTQATARFVIVASQHTHNYALKEKSKYCLYPKEHSTVEKRRWKTKGGGILFRVESLWMRVKVKNSCELKRYVSQNIRTIRSNSWNCTVNKFGVLANLWQPGFVVFISA